MSGRKSPFGRGHTLLRSPWILLAFLSLPVLPLGCGGGGSRSSDHAAGGASPPGKGDNAMQKQVSPDASFVLYAPAGWKTQESCRGGACAITAADPTQGLRVALSIGQGADDAVAATRERLGEVIENPADISITSALVSPDHKSLVADGRVTDRHGSWTEFRIWTRVGADGSTVAAIQAPEGSMERNRPALLTILANVRLMKGVMADTPTARVAMQLYRLPDGSASFEMPTDWRCQAQGAGNFIAGDQSGHIFMAGGVDLVTPRLGFTPPGGLVSPMLPPSRAWEFITTRLGLASDLRFESVTPRPDLSSGSSPNGAIAVEEFVYTCTSREGRRLKGYTFGMSIGGGAGLNWVFKHLSVFAPAESFDDYIPTFVAMLGSYRINDAYARNYVQQGMARLRAMQRQTSALIARNAEEIHSMMQAAYDERQRSEEYIDYQRTNTIRGQSDWISEMEGGAVYHTDSWGTQNTATGEYYPGAPYDYVHFEGENPKYNERMQPIDTRELFEKYRP